MTNKTWTERLVEGANRIFGIKKKEEDDDIDMEENSADPDALEGEMLIEAMTASLESSCGDDEIVVRFVS